MPTDAGENLRERVRAQFRERYPDYTIAELTTIEGIVRAELERAAEIVDGLNTGFMVMSSVVVDINKVVLALEDAATAIRKLKE